MADQRSADEGEDAPLARETSPGPGSEAAASPAAPPPKRGKFLDGSLMRHVVEMTLASSIGLMAIFLVDLADLYFISLLGEAELAAAVGYAAAILFFTTSVSIGLAIAMGALVARSIGVGDAERARVYVTHVGVASLATTAVVALLVWLFLPTLVAWVGATGRTAELAVDYLSIVAPSLPLLNIVMCGGAVLRAHGDARRSMNITLSVAAVNAVLDPLFIFGFAFVPALGLEGAALASVLARASGAAAAILPIQRRYGGFAPLKRPAFLADLREIARLSGPAMLTNVATPIGAAFVTRTIAEFGDAAVAGYAIVGRLTPVAFGLVFALSGAVGPIVGQNFGAKAYDRVRRTLWDALAFLAAFVVAMSLLLYLVRAPIADLFNASDEARVLVYWFCGPLALAFFFNGALFASNAMFNNLGRPGLAAITNWGRHTLGTIPPAMLGASLMGAPGVLIGQAVGGVLFGALAVWLAIRLVDAHEKGASTRSVLPSLALPLSPFPWRRR
ncbi:MAG: MATE family efflux transporter [Pseudomonadota bacterium]